MQKFWLTACKLNLQIQPEMTPIVFSRYSRNKINISSDNNTNLKVNLLTKKQECLTGTISENALFIGRIGHGSFPSSRSLRLDLKDLIKNKEI